MKDFQLINESKQQTYKSRVITEMTQDEYSIAKPTLKRWSKINQTAEPEYNIVAFTYAWYELNNVESMLEHYDWNIFKGLWEWEIGYVLFFRHCSCYKIHSFYKPKMLPL